MKIPYNPELREKARYLRKNSTLSEVLLWNEIKNGKLYGYDFHRQKPILNYIVDFFCHDLCLVIEIDGTSHDEKMDYDAKRQNEIEALGLTILRFSNLEVKKHLPQVLAVIDDYIEKCNGNV
ncbi:MAG: endonuclease domain-containing protein [Bacteroidia bacterium]